MTNTEQLQKLDRQHHLHPFTDQGDLNQRGTRIISRADGVYLWDSEGHKMLDGMAGLWCVAVGYGRKELADVAHQQMLELPYYNSFFQCTTPPAILLARKLAEVAPEHVNNVFFTGSGSESNDTVLRLVRHYWAVQGKPEKSVIISRKNAYHGSTVAGASLGGMGYMHKQGGLPIPGIEHIDQPYWFAEGDDLSPEEFGLQRARQLEEKILELGVDKVAAFIGEPLQGAGGVIIPPSSYWPEIQRICDKYGILLIADEVICGFGRTGNWFGSETFGIKPDFMPIAKGLSSGYLPIGGVLFSDRVAEVLKTDGGEINHGYTYSGHPAAAAVALKNLEIIQEENLVERVAEDTGPYLQQRWQELADHPIVGETRGVGLVCALELVKDKFTRERLAPDGKAGGLCRDFCTANGLIMRATGDIMLISPPLVITRDEIDELIEKAKKSLDDTLAAIEKGALEDDE
ncbi:aspartate aminotransferase family protein [Pseudomaricurvus alkylphenolicus]|uniref:aspartate aminotransferase family protein n=1 Tax=Pseudomaricurvus alkylphenolicus TaxID=1306991 RepID=UPI00141EA68F|nr:aspartate aminotransferase family protein [Pseudomaricurvus alkylphenolicus]NIB39431.1 aspartate aminotransferase family protein [Pseudomaricurvus alkylphenolicus]